MTCWAGCGFVGLVLAVWFTVTFPEPRNALLVGSSAAMLTGRAVGDASFAVSGQVELVWTRALVAWRALLDVTLDVEISRLWRR